MKDFSNPLFDDYFWFPKINSTSNQALKLINDRCVHGHFLVVADTQTNGRGRKGTYWTSPLGGLWMTAAFYGLPEQSNLTILIGNCIHQALLNLFPELLNRLTLKWPNDILLDTLKIAGILTEYYPAFNYTLIGIGINSNVQEIPDDLKSKATSLFLSLGKPINNLQITTNVFDLIAQNLPQYLEYGIKDHIIYHNRYSFLQGKLIEVVTDFGSYRGVCHGLNREGALILEMESGLKQPFFSGSVNILSTEG